MSEDAGQLIIHLEGSVIQTHLLDEPVLTIGRTPDNGLPLPHTSVSRNHAEVRLEPEGPLLTDLGSTNGTFVDGVRLLPHQPQLLADGAVVQIGPYLLVYRAPGRSRSADQAADEPEAAAEAAAETADETADQPPAPTRVPATRVPPAVVPAAMASPVVNGLTPGPESTLAARPTWPRPLAQGPVSSYLRDLPGIFQDNDFLGRFLLIFESLWEPLEQRQDHLAMYLDPRTCPVPFLPWLASWLDLAVDAHWPEARVRRLVAGAMDLYHWRGTRYGLTRMLEVCTGLMPQITEDPEEPFVFRISLAIPPESGLDEDFVKDLIEAHKPAQAGYVLEVVPWPS